MTNSPAPSVWKPAQLGFTKMETVMAEIEAHHWNASRYVCIRICVCVCVCMYVCIYIYIYTKMYVYIYIYANIYIYIGGNCDGGNRTTELECNLVYIYIYICMFLCMNVCSLQACTCKYPNTYTLKHPARPAPSYIYIYIYIYPLTHIHKYPRWPSF
jgi:hypothetical protein